MNKWIWALLMVAAQILVALIGMRLGSLLAR